MATKSLAVSALSLPIRQILRYVGIQQNVIQAWQTDAHPRW